MASIMIPVQADENSPNDWILIELQGEIRAHVLAGEDEEEGEDNTTVNRQGKKIGQLIDRNAENPILLIGNSKLEGKRMKMPKPFAILRKVGKGYETKGIVTQKFVFKTRPKPLTGANKV